MGINILSSGEQGFKRIMEDKNWTIAICNDSENLHPENLTQVSMHMESDEVFILMMGSAFLYVGEEKGSEIFMKRVELEPGKAYVVPRETWHVAITTPGCKLFIVENTGTCAENSRKIPVSQVVFDK